MIGAPRGTVRRERTVDIGTQHLKHHVTKQSKTVVVIVQTLHTAGWDADAIAREPDTIARASDAIAQTFGTKPRGARELCLRRRWWPHYSQS